MLKTSAVSGLSSEEAYKRQAIYGLNMLTAEKMKTFMSMFLAQFKSFMIIVLLVAAVVSGVVGVMESEGLIK